MSSSGKEECKVPVGGDRLKVGDFRFQKDYGADEFHVHHDAKNLKFVFARASAGDAEVGGIRRWELAWEQFQSCQHSFENGGSVLFLGEKIKDKKTKACDLVFTKKNNKWRPNLYLRGEFAADAVMGDATLTALDEWMQRY